MIPGFVAFKVPLTNCAMATAAVLSAGRIRNMYGFFSAWSASAPPAYMTGTRAFKTSGATAMFCVL
ncbi:hypothetical protein D3C86_1578740 [compost metagenome]